MGLNHEKLDIYRLIVAILRRLGGRDYSVKEDSAPYAFAEFDSDSDSDPESRSR